MAWTADAALWSFMLTRVAGYALAGAVVGSSAAAIGEWVNGSSLLANGLRSLWVGLHAAVLGFGLWWLWRGQLPSAWWRPLEALQVGPRLATAVVRVSQIQGPPALQERSPVHWQPRSGRALMAALPWRAGASGALWWAWPCGLLHSALLLAALTGNAGQGAMAMAAFAATSTPGLMLGPWLWRKLRASRWEALAMRLGALWLVAAGAWALWNDAVGGSSGGSLCIGLG